MVSYVVKRTCLEEYQAKSQCLVGNHFHITQLTEVLTGRKAKGTPSTGRSYLLCRQPFRNNCLFSTQVPHKIVEDHASILNSDTHHLLTHSTSCCHFWNVNLQSSYAQMMFWFFLQITQCSSVSLASLCTTWCFVVSCSVQWCHIVVLFFLSSSLVLCAPAQSCFSDCISAESTSAVMCHQQISAASL